MKEVNSIQAAQTEATIPADEVIYSKGYIAVNDDFYDESYDFEFLEPDLRRKCDIQDELHELSIINWHALLMCIRIKIEQGEIEVVESQSCLREYVYGDMSIGRDTWEALVQEIEHLEMRLGEADICPRTDFESGMVSGKLFALRWVLGCEWQADFNVCDSNLVVDECSSHIRGNKAGPTKAINLLDDAEINPDLEFVFQVRSKEEILKAENILSDKIWHTRHLIYLEKIEDGIIKVVEIDDYQSSNHADTVRRDILEAGMKASRKIERSYGLAFLGPWTDYEWGIFNGKLSALRWVLGEDWDQLSI